MKKTFILSLLALGLTACETMNRPQYSGGMGEYGFTYDLNGTPSPFIDTSYRPLTAYDLAAPILITVTNQAPPQIVYQTAPEIGATKYSGESPVRPAAIIAPQINEAAGADRGTPGPAGAAAGGAAAGTAGAAPGGGYYYPGLAVVFPGGSVTNTNNVPTNNIPTNNIPTNGIPTNNIPTNLVPINPFPTNRTPFPTNPPPTNAFRSDRPDQFGRRQAPSGFTNDRTLLNPDQQAPAQGQAPAINEPSGSPAPAQPSSGQGQQPVPFGTPAGGNAPRPTPAPAPSPAPAPAAPSPAPAGGNP